MKTTMFAFTLLTLLAAAPALAQVEGDSRTTVTTMQETPAQSAKTFGIGYGQTPGGVLGAEVEYYLGNLMLNAHFGFLFFSPSGDADSVNSFGLAVGAFFRWKTWDNVALMIGGRLDIGHTGGGGTGTEGGDATQFNIEVPLRAEIYFAEILSLHAEVGPVLGIVDEGGGVLAGWKDKPKGTYLDLPAVNVLATVGVTIYFR